MQTHVITEKQARQITGGRKPLVPIQYEEARTNLQACMSIDDAIVWENKADALAAWAKMYHEDAAGEDARRLKLVAKDRIGKLAMELRPGGMKERVDCKGRRGLSRADGPASLLKEHGLSNGHVRQALTIARAPRDKFENAVKKAMGVNTAIASFGAVNPMRGQAVSSDAWRWLTSTTADGTRLFGVRCKLRSRPARVLASKSQLVRRVRRES
jgi:hypothetical protein